MQADAFAGFSQLYEARRRPAPIIEAACWSHSRRKFFDLAKLTKAPIACEAIRRIDELFEIERSINGCTPEERLAVRQQQSKPLVEAFEAWLRYERDRVSSKSEIAKAINYSLSRWPAFTRFLDDGRICLSNNAPERALRGVAIGRANWTFAGSDAGGHRAAAVYTLVETCKLNNVDPQAWLAYVLQNFLIIQQSGSTNCCPGIGTQARSKSKPRLKLLIQSQALLSLKHRACGLHQMRTLQTHEMLFDAHYHGFRVLGGVPRRGIYDNMCTTVDRVGVGKERQVNARFAAMASHYLFEAEFCNPASGWEKGQVEKNVRDARHRLWQPAPRFPTLDALHDWLEQRCKELWREIPHGSQPGTLADAWEGEAASLMPLSRPFDGFVESSKRVSPTCLVHLERYSVPASFANRPVSLRVYPNRIVVVAEGRIVCEHQRVIDRSHSRQEQTIYDWRHYLAVIHRKPGTLRNGAPFAELPDAFKQLQ